MRASGVRTHLPGRVPKGPCPGRTLFGRVRARSSAGPDGPGLRGGDQVQLPPRRATRRWAPRALARPVLRPSVRLHDPAASVRAILVAVTAASGSQWCASRRGHSMSPRPPKELRTVIPNPWPRVCDGRGPEGPSISALRGCPPSGDLAGCRSSVPTKNRHVTYDRAHCPALRGKTQDVPRMCAGSPQKVTAARASHAGGARLCPQRRGSAPWFSARDKGAPGGPASGGPHRRRTGPHRTYG